MKATVVNTVENTTKVVDLPEAVTDLTGLKHFLDISDGQFFEGTTHTDLTSDSQALPQLPESKKERGYVFFVSPEQNKIKNGAYDRKTCYGLIKENHLEDKVKAEFGGRNFTQVATDALNNIIRIYVSGSVSHEEAAPSPEPVETPVAEDADAGKITTEKELLQEIVAAIAHVSAGEEYDAVRLVEGINRVFPSPYSVQDLANMRK